MQQGISAQPSTHAVGASNQPTLPEAKPTDTEGQATEGTCEGADVNVPSSVSCGATTAESSLKPDVTMPVLEGEEDTSRDCWLAPTQTQSLESWELQLLRVSSELKMKLKDPHFVAKRCDLDSFGGLDVHELKQASRAFGIKFSTEELQEKMAGEARINKERFAQVVADAPVTSAHRSRPTIPHSLRGMALGQLQQLESIFITSGWLSAKCNAFNLTYAKAIREGTKFPQAANLYAMDTFVVTPMSQPGKCDARDQDSANVVPEANEKMSFSEVVNPYGLIVHCFVSHFWGHLFSQTVTALRRWAEMNCERIGAESSKSMVYWICLFALNQHAVADEVGENPMQGPFNAALAQAEGGAVMVLDGGKRPLAIASLAWRVGMAAIIKTLRPWIKSWSPPELSGGVPNKGIHNIHAELFQVLENCQHQRQRFAGCKADVKKCFDSVQPNIAIAIWRRLGAPVSVLHVLTSFYSSQNRWFAVRNAFAKEPVQTNCSLLQGCPASPSLLNGLMTVWVKALAQLAPQVKVAIFLDDRTVWATGPDAAQHVLRAMQQAQPVDAALGFTLHPDKLESFATQIADKEFLQQNQAFVGPCQTSFKLLGIQYFVGSRKQCRNDEKLHKSLLERCRKIRIVTKNTELRKRLVQILVVSMLRWMGPWQRFPLKDLQTWASAVETSIWGSRIPSGRSRFLFWSCVAGMECHPKCAIDVETIKMEWRRQVCVKFNLPAPTSPTKQASKVLAEIKWTVLPNGVWSTPFGHLRLGWVADKTVVRLARRSWSRLLYDNDTKVNHPLPAHLEPYLEFSKNVIKEGGERYKQTVAVAAATDGRLLLRKEHPVHCECGDQCPTRHHLTFECQSQGGSIPVRKSDEENRLLVPLVTLPPSLPCSMLRPIPEFVETLQTKYAQLSSPVTMALDGSCITLPGRELWQVASWGVALSETETYQDQVNGVDRTPAAAERAALIEALLAAHAARVPVRLLVDNEAIVKRLRRGLRCNWWTGDVLGFWLFVAGLITYGVEIMWVPSHYKKSDWQPELPWGLSADECRQLNSWADGAACTVTSALHPDVERNTILLRTAHAWAAAVFERQWKCTQPFHNILKTIMSRHDDLVL